MSWRIVYVENAEEMRLYLDNVKLIREEQEILIPLSDIHTIVIDNGKTLMTTKILNKLAEYHIMTVFCNDEHLPNAFSMGLYSHYKVFGVLKKQLNWSSDLKDSIWKEIVSSKILNQRTIIDLVTNSKDVSISLFNLAKRVTDGDKENKEGQAARIYFQELFGNDFTREKNSVDVTNAALNYGYAILRAVVARVVVAHGLHPAIGVGHRNQFNAFNLVDDLMEVFRPIVDLWVISLVKNAEYFSKDLKILLIRKFSTPIIIDNQRQTLLNAVEIYVNSFIRKMNEQSTERLIVPHGIAI